MKIFNKKLPVYAWIAIAVGWLAFISHRAMAVESIQFDPNGEIKNSLQLPDKSPVDITIRTIQWVLGMLGLVAVIMIIFGGFMWMTAAGNEERVKKAKTILTSAIIGMIVILLSWAMVTFVVVRVNNVTT
ncbi:MAG: hypothetical protein WC544_03740 [Patescibacteria group bacterium]